MTKTNITKTNHLPLKEIIKKKINTKRNEILETRYDNKKLI